MTLPKIIGDLYEDEQVMILSFLTHLFDYDNYNEWYKSTYSDHLFSMKNAIKKEFPKESNRCELERIEFEKILKQRETITLEELRKYTGEKWHNDTKRHRFLLIIAVYEDFFHEDKNFNKELLEATKEYFNVTKEDMEWARL